MNRPWHQALAALCLLATWATGLWLGPGRPPAAPAAPNLPLRIGAWAGAPQMLPAGLEPGAGPALSRSYRTPGEDPVYLLAMAYDSSRHNHSPEICYAGIGWRLARQTDAVLPTGDRLRRLRGESDRPETLLIYYGVATAGRLTTEGLRLKAQDLQARLLGHLQPHLFVEVTTVVPPGHEAAGDARIARFLAALSGTLTP